MCLSCRFWFFFSSKLLRKRIAEYELIAPQAAVKNLYNLERSDRDDRSIHQHRWRDEQFIIRSPKLREVTQRVSRWRGRFLRFRPRAENSSNENRQQVNKVDERPSDWPIGCSSGGVSNWRPIYLPPHPVMWYVTSNASHKLASSLHAEGICSYVLGCCRIQRYQLPFLFLFSVLPFSSPRLLRASQVADFAFLHKIFIVCRKTLLKMSWDLMYF